MKEEREGVGGKEGRGGSESGTFIHVQRIPLFLSFQYIPKTFLPLLCPSANQPKIEGECAKYCF